MHRSELLQIIRNELVDPMNGKVGAHVFDLHENKELISHAGDDQFLLASLTKIFTVGAAFEHLGSEKRFTTRVAATAPPVADGTINGDLYIIGGGDPTLAARDGKGDDGQRVDEIAKAIEAAGVRRVIGGIVADASLFNEYETAPAGWITALSVNRRRHEEPARTAATAINNALERLGIHVQGNVTEHQALPEATLIGTIESPTVEELAIAAGHESDNYISETLIKHIAAATSSHGRGDTARGCTVTEEHAAALGADVQLENGSGLRVSRGKNPTGNLGTPIGIVNYLRATRDHKHRYLLETSLPRAARDGTLETRMRNSAAVGSVRAKTGTLTNERRPLQDSLAGYCAGPSRELAFAFIYERAESRFVARSSLDRLADALAKYCGSRAEGLPIPRRGRWRVWR